MHVLAYQTRLLVSSQNKTVKISKAIIILLFIVSGFINNLSFATEEEIKNEIIEPLIQIYEDLKLICEKIEPDNPAVGGIKAVVKNIEATFNKQSVEIINTEKALFDHTLHEAIKHTEDTKFADNQIISQSQSGYKINGKVQRSSKVEVAKNKVSNDGANVNE